MIPQKVLRHMLRDLRKRFPTRRPVVVRQVELARGRHGETSFSQKTKRFLIELNKKSDGELLQMVLSHEWAHVLTWEAQRVMDIQEHHDVIWAVAYKPIWDWWEKEWCQQ